MSEREKGPTGVLLGATAWELRQADAEDALQRAVNWALAGVAVALLSLYAAGAAVLMENTGYRWAAFAGVVMAWLFWEVAHRTARDAAERVKKLRVRRELWAQDVDAPKEGD